jgi:hypothetical protein
MLPSSPGAFTTIPLGRIHDMVAAPPKPRQLQQLFSGRQAYLEEAAAGNSTRMLRMQGRQCSKVDGRTARDTQFEEERTWGGRRGDGRYQGAGSN